MAIELFATACVLSRTQALIDEQGFEGTTREVALCDLFCVEAGRRFRAARLALDDREDEVDTARRDVAAAVRQFGGYFAGDPIQAEITRVPG